MYSFILLLFLLIFILSKPYNIRNSIKKCRYQNIILKLYNNDNDDNSYKSPLSQKWYRDRQRKISPNLKKIYNTYWSKYGVDLEYGIKINIDKNIYTILDIGFGTGESIIGMFKQSQDISIIGIEIYRAGIAAAIKQLIELEEITKNTENKIKFVRRDVTHFMEYIDDDTLNEICVFFPDPWLNEERDIGKRVIRNNMLEIFIKKLKPNGLLRISTDVENYATYINSTINSYNNNFKLVNYAEHTAGFIFNNTRSKIYRPITKYERIAFNETRNIHEFEYRLEK